MSAGRRSIAMGLDDADESAYQRRPLKRGSSRPSPGLESSLAQRVEALTATFVDAIFAAIRSFPLEEIRPELARRAAIASAASPRASHPPPSRRTGDRDLPPTSRRTGDRDLPPTSRRTNEGAPRSRRFAERSGDDDAPASENVITNPEALLRAAFGDPAPTDVPSTSANLDGPLTRPPPSMRGSAIRPGAKNPASEPTTSSASRVIRRRRH